MAAKKATRRTKKTLITRLKKRGRQKIPGIGGSSRRPWKTTLEGKAIGKDGSAGKAALTPLTIPQPRWPGGRGL